MDSVSQPDLYHSEKYNVFVGKQSNLSLCTCWTDPNLIIKKEPPLLDTFALIGTLYSREGVSIILRNLLLNTFIDHVIIWSGNPLSNTAIGIAGRNLLKNLWELGVDEENNIKGTNECVHKEIAGDTINAIRREVKLVDLTSASLSDVLKETDTFRKKKVQHYMKAISFPEPKREALAAMPSEKVGIAVRSQTLTGAWVKVVDKIIRYGGVKKTETGSNQKELQSVTWTIHNEDSKNLTIPEWPDNIKKYIGLDKDILEQYKTIFIDPKKPEGTAYTYGNRLNDYIGKINQVQEIIQKLKYSSLTRQGFATTFYPPEDLKQPSPPCLTNVQILSGEGKKINMFASFRSHDIFKAAIPNAFGLLHLHNHIANKAGYEKGSLTIISVSAHIYEEDWKMALDTVKCALWERTKLYFDETEDIDPRGIVRISIKNLMLYVEIITDTGDVLFEYSGKSAREVAMKIARLELLSLYTHYVDVSIELVKAEIALKNGMTYSQDRPFILEKTVIK